MASRRSGDTGVSDVALMMAVGRAMTEDESDRNLGGFLADPLFA
jgi:hypothetical protein